MIERKHMLAALIAGMGMLMAFVIGCAIVNVPDSHHTPIITTFLSFLALLASQLWSKADTDRQIQEVKKDVKRAAHEAEERHDA